MGHLAEKAPAKQSPFAESARPATSVASPAPAPAAKAPLGTRTGGKQDLDYASHYVDVPAMPPKDVQKFERATGIRASDRKRLREWQKTNGVDPTGVVDKDSINLAVYTSKDLQTRQAQQNLVEELGFYLEDKESFAATRSDPEKRKAFIKDWQAKQGLAPTGVLTPQALDLAQRKYQAGVKKDGADMNVELMEEFNFYSDSVCRSHEGGPKKQIDAKKLAAWQKKFDVPATGVVDQATLAMAKRHFRGAGFERVNAHQAEENNALRLDRDRQERDRLEKNPFNDERSRKMGAEWAAQDAKRRKEFEALGIR